MPTPRPSHLLWPILGSLGAVVALIAIFLVGMNAGNPVRKDSAAATPAPAVGGGAAGAANGSPIDARHRGLAVRNCGTPSISPSRSPCC